MRAGRLGLLAASGRQGCGLGGRVREAGVWGWLAWQEACGTHVSIHRVSTEFSWGGAF